MLNVILTGTSDMDPAHKTTTLILSHTLVVREPNVTCPRHAVLPTVHVCKQSPIAAEVTGPLSKKIYTHIYTVLQKLYYPTFNDFNSCSCPISESFDTIITE